VAGAIASALHLFALVCGLAGVFARGRAMREPFTDEQRDRMFAADNWWGIASMLWIGSGLWRLLGGLDKPTDFYLHSPAFHVKMGFFAVLFALEIWPMITFIKWRVALQKKQPIDTAPLKTFRIINTIEVIGVILMVFTAAAMARGIGRRDVVAKNDECAVRDLMTIKCMTCHSSAAKQAGLDMTQPIVGTESTLYPGEVRIIPGDPEKSFLYRKVAGTHGGKGVRMPLGTQLPQHEIDLISRWIRDGAKVCQ
jgi:putative membrane protein